MIKNYIFILLVLVGFSAYSQSSSPEIHSSAGESFQTNNVRIDWTLGEIAVSTISNSNIRVTQGFHQPNYMVTDINQVPAHLGKIKLFPNPTTDQLNIELSLKKSESIDIFLFDAHGKTVRKRTFSGKKISKNISLLGLPSGQYFLSIKIGQNSIFQTHMIQKIN